MNPSIQTYLLTFINPDNNWNTWARSSGASHLEAVEAYLKWWDTDMGDAESEFHGKLVFVQPMADEPLPVNRGAKPTKLSGTGMGKLFRMNVTPPPPVSGITVEVEHVS